MVDEKMVEKTYLDWVSGEKSKEDRRTNLVASGVDNLSPFESRMTRNTTSKSGTNNEVTKRGMACRSKQYQLP